jgi:hypothetical protein
MKKSILLLSIFFIISCSKEEKIIPLYITNLEITEIDKVSGRINYNFQYKDTQTLECEIEKYFLVANDLKITGVGAFYDGTINLTLTTNRVWIEEDHKIIPYKISFELYGAGLNGRKSPLKISLDDVVEAFIEIN